MQGGFGPARLVARESVRRALCLAVIVVGAAGWAGAAAAESRESQPIGVVETVVGEALAFSAAGTRVTLREGVPVVLGDTVETGVDAVIGIVFIDDSTFALGPEARMVLDAFIFDPGAGAGASVFTVVQGVFSFVSGEIAETGPEAMAVRTPVATIGIRGTRVAGRAAPEGEVNTVTLLPSAEGEVGEVVVRNAGGVRVLNAANQTVEVRSAFSAPSPASVLGAAEVAARYGTVLAALPANGDGRGRDASDENSDEPAAGGAERENEGADADVGDDQGGGKTKGGDGGGRGQGANGNGNAGGQGPGANGNGNAGGQGQGAGGNGNGGGQGPGVAGNGDGGGQGQGAGGNGNGNGKVKAGKGGGSGKAKGLGPKRNGPPAWAAGGR